MKPNASGPLAGLRVVEFAGLGPGPFACMLLSDMGADVVTVERRGVTASERGRVVGRGRTCVQADLKVQAERDDVMELLRAADVLVEGFRPGVMERLGLGPDAVAALNPRLVYGRITGWGQTGPLAHAAGHDINYIALSGALAAIGPAHGAPCPPLNLVGDYAAGSLYLVSGVLAALHERHASGRGQVVDAAITDGTLSLMSLFVEQAARGQNDEKRGSNLLDGGAPFYGCYRTADDAYVSIGPLEPAFFAQLCERIGLAQEWHGAQHDRAAWPAMRAEIERIFMSRTRADWCERLEGTDACFAPVLWLSEAEQHAHHRARGAFVEVGGMSQPAPAPRLSRTPSAVQGATPEEIAGCDEVLRRWAMRTVG